MKKLLIAVLALSTSVIFAQDLNQQKMSNAIKKRMIKKGKGSPEDRSDFETKHLALKLDLTKDQQKEVKSALLAHYSENNAKMKERRNSKVKPTPEERKKMRLARMDSQIDLKAKMKSILSAEQYTKYSEMFERKMEKKKRRKNRK